MKHESSMYKVNSSLQGQRVRQPLSKSVIWSPIKWGESDPSTKPKVNNTRLSENLLKPNRSLSEPSHAYKTFLALLKIWGRSVPVPKQSCEEDRQKKE
jgi:hypothetical protein